MSSTEPNAPVKPKDTVCCGLLRRRQCLRPTLRGWVLFLLAVVTAGGIGILSIHPFLAVNDSQPGGALVVEGWAPDYALEAAVAEFKKGKYQKVYVTGGPLEWGAPLSEYKTHAARGAATLVKLGLETQQVEPVPAPLVRQDRTFVAGVALRKWWSEHGVVPGKINLLTLGPHARRSRLMLEKALGKDAVVGVLAVPELDYDARRWWVSSQGVRSVMSETIAYAYARVLFRVPAET